MIDREQLRIARRSVELTQARLSRESGISMATINAIENGFEFRSTTMRALEAALKARGAIFGSNGEVSIKMVWEEPVPADAAVRAGVLRFLNSQRKAKGQAPYIDCEDE